MPNTDLNRIAIPLLAAAMVVTATAGVTYAASSSHAAKACETSKDVLVLSSHSGHCPKGDHKVTLGATGHAGKTGKTGPSNGYVATQRNEVAVSGQTSVLSISLPAGSYLLTGDANFQNADTSGAASALCELVTGTATSQPFGTSVAAGETVITTVLPGAATADLSTGLTLPAAASVSISCESLGSVSATGSIIAQQVGSLTATGNAAFG